MYLAILRTHYEIYALGVTEEEAKKNVVKGYKKIYPNKNDRSVEKATFKELEEYFGIAIHYIDNRGYTSE